MTERLEALRERMLELDEALVERVVSGPTA